MTEPYPDFHSSITADLITLNPTRWTPAGICALLDTLIHENHRQAGYLAHELALVEDLADYRNICPERAAIQEPNE